MNENILKTYWFMQYLPAGYLNENRIIYHKQIDAYLS